MPKDFDACVSGGGRVRTKTLSGGRYMHICFLGDKSYAGEVKKAKASKIKDGENKGKYKLSRS
jgi:hypothetical protein